MTEHTGAGTKATHIDAYVDDFQNSNGDTKREVDLTYQHDSSEDDTDPSTDQGNEQDPSEDDTDPSTDQGNEQDSSEDDTDPSTERGKDVELAHPVDDVEELLHEAHLTVQFGEANRMEDTGSPTVFDEAILRVADRALHAAGVTVKQSTTESIDKLPAKPRHVKALLLHDAWALNSHPQLTDDLKERDVTAQRLGYNSVPDQSTFWRTEQRLRDDGYRDAVRNAATRAVHAVVRNGVITPDASLEAHGLNFSPEIDEREVAQPTRRKAIRTWVDSLLQELLNPISFDRSENLSHAVEAIIAAVAQAAYAHGVNSARPTAGWYYDQTDIPTAGQVSRLLRGQSTDDLLQIFTSVNATLIEVASEHGFFERDYDFAVDTTWVSSPGDQDDDDDELKLIDNPKHGQSWLFAVLGVTDTDARFALGLDLVEDKSETTKQFRYLVRTAGVLGGVDRIHIDREFWSGDAVRMCRANAKNNWVIRAKIKDGSVAESLLEDTPEGESNFKANIEFSDVDPNPNLVVAPMPEAYRDDGNTHFVFLTDLHVDDVDDVDGDDDDDDVDPIDIRDDYLKRWSVETLLRQLKHDVGVTTSSPHPRLRTALFHIATLFYNIHTLINRASDPTYALRLNVPFYEVLIAVIDSIYTRSPATRITR